MVFLKGGGAKQAVKFKLRFFHSHSLVLMNKRMYSSGHLDLSNVRCNIFINVSMCMCVCVVVIVVSVFYLGMAPYI